MTVATVTVALAIANVAVGATLTFSLDGTASILEASAEIVVFDPPVQLAEQGPGSRLVGYTGTVVVDVDDVRSPSTIRFVSAAISAGENGNWLPAAGGGMVGDPGTKQPANYGFFLDRDVVATVWGAVREFELSVESEELIASAGRFPSDVLFEITSGTVDFNFVSFLLPNLAGSDSQVGKVSENTAADGGSYVVDKGLATLSIPVEIVFTANETAVVTLAGGLVSSPLRIDVVALDCDGDGVVDINDVNCACVLRDVDQVNAILTAIGSINGDTDGNGKVEFRDFLILANNFGKEGEFTDGDFNCNGKVEFPDFLVLASNFGQSGLGQAASVPEPNGIVVLGLAGVALLAIGRRGRFSNSVPSPYRAALPMTNVLPTR